MTGLLIGNIVVLAFAGVFATISFFGWLKAEKKLAKYGESKIFLKEKENDK